MLFGYTDVSADPSGLHPDDPDLKSYEGLAPGFAEMLRLRLDTPGAWVGYLKAKGYELPDNYWDLYKPPLDQQTATEEDPLGSPIRSPALYAAEHSDTAFLTDRTLEELSGRESDAWFSLVTYIRPHPPLVAPSPYNTVYAPETLPEPMHGLPLAELRQSHPFFNAYFSEPTNFGLYMGFDGEQDRISARHIQEMRAVYLGLALEVDHHIGRLLDYLRISGQYDDTLIVVTADHGEMLGDQHQWGKVCPFDAALKIPLIIRDPRQPDSFGQTVSAFTESVDIAPTLAEWSGAEPYSGYDGRSLLPLLSGVTPADWRQQVFAEAELGDLSKPTQFQKATRLSAERANFALLQDSHFKYVHFNGELDPLLYDLQSDPNEFYNIANDDKSIHTLSRMASRMLDHRMTYGERAMSRLKITPEGLFVS